MIAPAITCVLEHLTFPGWTDHHKPNRWDGFDFDFDGACRLRLTLEHDELCLYGFDDRFHAVAWQAHFSRSTFPGIVAAAVDAALQFAAVDAGTEEWGR